MAVPKNAVTVRYPRALARLEERMGAAIADDLSEPDGESWSWNPPTASSVVDRRGAMPLASTPTLRTPALVGLERPSRE